ncbi:MAG: ABC transporter permease [Pirellulales bacterium]|nr:ABC transporter permease [Pirellulales bacterium]
MWKAIYSREISGVLGSRWAWTLFVVPLALLGGLVISRWPSEAEVDLAGGRSRELLALIGYTTLGCVIFLTPAFPATSIVSERRRGTLALLLRTPVTRAGLYAGKFLGTCTCILLPLAMSAPAIAACYAMGGISLTAQVLPLYAVLALTAFLGIAASLWVSRFAATPGAAVRGAYALAVVMAVVTLGPGLFVPGGSSGGLAYVAGFLRGISPIPAVMEILGRAPGGASLSQPGSPSAVVRFALTAALLTGGLAIHTALSLRPTMFDRVRAAGAMTQDRGRVAQSWRRLLFLIDPQRRTSAMPGWINPVLIKELRSRRFGRGHWMARLAMICAIVSLGLTYAATTGSIAWSPEAVGGIMVLLQTALIVLLTPSFASSLISEERETGAWALLCMTPLSPRKIVAGKLLSVAWTVSLVLLATLPGYAVMILVKPVLFQQVRDVLATLILLALFAVGLSAAAGAFFRQTTTATLVAYLSLVSLLAAPMVVWLGRDAPFGHGAVERALRFSPLAAALSLLEAPGFETYDLLPTAWWTVAGGIVMCFVLLCWQSWRLMQPR